MTNKQMTTTIIPSANPIAERLQELVDRLVKEKKIKNQADFARKAGLRYTNIFEVKQGKRNITIEMVIAICTAFGVSADWILLGKEETQPDKERLNRLEDIVSELLMEKENREITGKFKGKKHGVR